MDAPPSPTLPAAPPGGRLWLELRKTASALEGLATALSINWDKMNRKAQPALVWELEKVAGELHRLAERSFPILMDRDLPASAEESLSYLTRRELEVLRALANGRSTGQVAQGLGITPTTVRSHVKSLLAKLGMHSRVEAVCLFLRHEAARLGVG